MTPLSHPRFQWILYAVEFLIGTVLLFLFGYLENRGIRVFLLLVGSGLVVLILLRMIRRITVPFPDLLCKQFSSSFGITLTASFTLLNTRAVLILALGWLFLLYGVVAGYRTLKRLVVSALLFTTISRLYKKGHPLKLSRNGQPLAFIYVLAEQGLGVFQAHRLCSRLSHSLMRHRKERVVIFLSSGELQHYSEDFRKWLAAQCAALLVVQLPDEVADKNFVSLVPEYCALSLGSIFQVTLQPSFYKATEVSPSPYQATVSTDISSINLEYFTQHQAIATLTDQLAMSTFAIADADATLPDELRGMIPLIAQQGLPPIANTYLRARLSQSDVERFLSILDCIEATIKCSVIALLTTQWQAGTVNNSAAIASQLNVPSLGHWIDILCTVITHQPQTSFQKQIADFWYAPLVQTAREVIEDANQSGFSWRGDIPQNDLQWLRWFSWLRNVTRGHGVVKEESIGNLWRSLQKTFLQFTFGLEVLTLCTKLQLRSALGKTSSFVGWARSTGIPEQRDLESDQESTLFLGHGAELTPLFPFVIGRAGSVLLWNTIRNRSIEYIDCRSGQLCVLTYPETDPHTLWKHIAERS